MPVLLPLLLAFFAVPLSVLVGAWRPRWVGPTAVAATAATFVSAVLLARNGGGGVDLAWAPTWQLRLSFALDGLALLFVLIASGVGVAVALFSWAYIPRHLAHEGRPQGDQIAYFAVLLLFMAAMIGMAMALDLLLLFIFWDLTAITSYYLIGFDRHKAEAREAALMALLVTGISSVLFLIGALMLYATYETFSLPLLYERITPGPVTIVAAVLVAIAALAKSAQAPFHFWLPRAMAAPAPVSAYLHSAAMVAAGVFLLARVYPLLQASRLLLDALIAIGFLSIVIAGLLALHKDQFKQVLAYSTISQYGYVVVMLGVGGATGVGAALFYILIHAPIKSALFLTAGAITEATGNDRLSRSGGLLRSLPLLAAGSAAASASLAALPLTAGFFKDELLFKTALEHSRWLGALVVLGAALTFAYTWRWWSGIFLGSRSQEVQAVGARLILPVVVLGFIVLAGGVFVTPFARLAEAAGAAASGATTSLQPAYHLDLRAENVMALVTYLTGALILAARRPLSLLSAAVSALGRRVGPERIYHGGLSALNWLSTQLFDAVRVLRLGDRVLAMLIPAAILLGLNLLAIPQGATYQFGSFRFESDLPVLIALILTAGSALAVAFPRGHLTLVLAVTAVNYSLAAFFTFYGAPDVALVTVLISTVSTLFFLGIFILLPSRVLQRQAQRSRPGWRRVLDILVAAGAGGATLVVVWGVLSQSPPRRTVASELLQLTPSAHAADAVTAILADFRGLDTLGEATVIVIALIGILDLLRRRFR